MKSTFFNFFSLLTLALTLSMLSGCGGNSIEDSKLMSNQPMAGAPGDIPTFSGPRSNYFIVKNADNYSIQDKVGSDGTRVIPIVEKIKFSDVTLTLNMEQQVAQISKADYQLLVELYIAFFNRLPDAEGLSYWIGQVKAGVAMNDISNSFYNAGILYSSLTGYSTSMSNEEFIKIIYKNVLGRSEVDQGGLTYWSTSLASGSETRGTLIKSILNSAHTFKGDATWGYVADLLDNKFTVANNFANIGGVTFNTPNESITKGMEILALVTSTDITAATKLVNVRAANAAPVANAGVTQVAFVDNVISLNGVNSSDANGDPLTYSWVLMTKPLGSKATLMQASSAIASFTADYVGTYVFSLSVSDGKIISTTTTTVYTVTSQTPLLEISPYITYPVSLDTNYRLTNAKAVLAMRADESAFVASAPNDYGWKMQATYSKQGLFKVPVKQGYYYQFSTSSFWGPCMTVYDGAGYSLGLTCAPSSFTTSYTKQSLLAAQSGFVYVDVTSQISPVFKNADLVIDVNTDSKGIDGGQQVDLSSFATGSFAGYINFGFYGGTGNDKIIGKPLANNTIYGGDGDDVIEIKSTVYASSFVDGGNGTDTLIVGFPSTGISLKKVAAFGYGHQVPGERTDSYYIVDKSITIRNIERIQFTDKTMGIVLTK